MKLKFIYSGLALACGLMVWLSFSANLFSGLENYLEDSLFSVKPFSQDIVILSIDNESIQKLGQWPWPRRIFSEALNKMNGNPPAAVGVDVIFSEPSRFGAGDDYELADSLKQIKYPVIFPTEAEQLTFQNNIAYAVKFLKPLPLFLENSSVSLGQANLILDADSAARKFPLKVSGINSFAYEITKRSGSAIPNESSLKNINRIAYAAPAGSVRRIPFWRVMEDGSINLKNKIVLIGATASDLHDEKPTPFSKGTQMPGVEIHANIANMLIYGYRLENSPLTASFIWIFLAALLPAVFSAVSNSFLFLSINLGIGIFYLLAIFFLFEIGISANILHISFSWIFSVILIFSYRYFVIEKEKREIKNVFSKYVSKDVLEEILKDPAKVKLGGEEKEVTVFFSDIRGFTTLSEKTTPKELVRILNKYFTLMTNEVLKNGGVLDKYIGDAIMAFWGAPIEDRHQAENALQASLGMLEKLKELNKELKSSGDPEINIGIGLYTGPAIVGNIGSDLRFDYTAMGDTVNVASRLEGLNKEYKTQIIIGETTKNKLAGNYNFKFLGSVAVKGRKEPLNIYTIVI